MANAVKGLIVGAFLGGLAGLGACVWLIPVTLFFPGDTILAGAIICGACGYIWGDSFFDWLSEHWYWFS